MTALRRLAVGLLCLTLGLAALLAAPAPRATAAPAADRESLPLDAPVMLVVDTSGSMAEPDAAGKTKIEGAKTALLQLLDALPPTSRIGMRTYPAGGDDCGTGRPDFPVTARDPGVMSAVVRTLDPIGGTPTAEALQAGVDDVRAAGYRAATIVLVSDGKSTCDPPCPVAEALVAQGFDLTVNTVGFQIDSAGAEELQCIADATGGTYTDVRDSAELGAKLAATQAARLSLDVSAPQTFSPGASQSLTITASVQNTSYVLARDVRLSLVFSTRAATGSPTVLRPIRVLGNLAGQDTNSVTWTVYPSIGGEEDAGQFDYTVTVSSALTRPQQQAGSISVRAFSLSAAAPWLQDTDHVVVLGDSYSSGEGGGDYVADDTKGCHRSPNTYAYQLFPDTTVDNLACSGAVINDYWSPQAGRNVRPQDEQLDDVDGYDLVLLTMGGNDIGFADIIVDCARNANCGGRFDDPAAFESTLGALQSQLTYFYGEVLADTGVAPVVVLPYIGVVPTGDVTTGCSGTRALAGKVDFDAGELAIVQWLITELNRHLEAAVEAVHDSRLVFASDVADAVRPAHTLCSEERWVVGLGDFGADALLYNKGQRQQLVHPNAEGYRAIAAALARWSTSLGDPRDGARSRPHRYEWIGNTVQLLSGALTPTATVDLQNSAAPTSVRPGAPLVVRAGGYAPNSPVLVVAHSSPQTLAAVYSDGSGDVEMTLGLPEGLRPGDHSISVEGAGAGGDRLVQEVPLDVGHLMPWGGLLVALLTLLLAGAGGLTLRLAFPARDGSPRPSTQG